MMQISRVWMVLAVMILALLGMQAQADERPAVADKVVAYAAEQGIKVWTLRIGERSEHKALVQIEGVDHDWDMRIQKMDVAKTSKDTCYSTEVDGQKFVTLLVQGNWGELYLPGEAQPLHVRYDQYLSEQGNAQAFLTDYLNAKP